MSSRRVIVLGWNKRNGVSSSPLMYSSLYSIKLIFIILTILFFHRFMILSFYLFHFFQLFLLTIFHFILCRLIFLLFFLFLLWHSFTPSTSMIINFFLIASSNLLFHIIYSLINFHISSYWFPFPPYWIIEHFLELEFVPLTIKLFLHFLLICTDKLNSFHPSNSLIKSCRH